MVKMADIVPTVERTRDTRISEGDLDRALELRRTHPDPQPGQRLDHRRRRVAEPIRADADDGFASYGGRQPPEIGRRRSVVRHQQDVRLQGR